jgi:hypothetical protein
MSAPAPAPHDAGRHPERKELARFLLGRGRDRLAAAGRDGQVGLAADVLARARGAGAREAIAFPDRLAPTVVPGAGSQPGDPLPEADVVAITWTVDELAGLPRVLTPDVDPSAWQDYDRRFSERHRPELRPRAPAATSGRLGSYQLTQIGPHRVLCMKSELHLNQDGKRTGDGTRRCR